MGKSRMMNNNGTKITKSHRKWFRRHDDKPQENGTAEHNQLMNAKEKKGMKVKIECS